MINKLNPTNPILIVDDEKEFLLSAELTLKSFGFNNIKTAVNGKSALKILQSGPVDIVLLDINMPDISGTELLEKIVSETPDTPVIMVTAENDISIAVKCIKQGAYNYLPKPLEQTQFYNEVRRGLEYSELKKEKSAITEKLLTDTDFNYENFSPIVTQNEHMIAIFKYVEAISFGPGAVLISGETGTGKELIARAIHKSSNNHEEFLAVNISGLDELLFSDTLFGHLPGAYTGAQGSRLGLIEKVGAGTLFLDEIGDLNAASQVKLLRLLQENEYYPLGSDIPRKSTCRFIFATNRNLKEMQEKGEFRKDLYYRLRMHHIQLMPLRKRKDDIPLLIEHFIIQAAEALGKKVPTYPEEIIPLMQSYHFPGNIRELESIIYDAVAHHKGKIMSLKSIKNAIEYNEENMGLLEEMQSKSLIINENNFPTLKIANKIIIQEALKRSKGNQSIAAKMLGFTRQALNQRLHQYESNDQ